jgi:hypothetical protein
MTEKWGPPTWALFHTLIEKLDEKYFNILGPSLFTYISRICRLLPCPECQSHAREYILKSVRIFKLDTASKKSFREFIYNFHNAVNKRKRYSEPSIDILNNYRTNNIGEVYNNFISTFNTRGNMQLLADTMQRSMLIRDFKNWLLSNKKYFTH